MSSQEIDTTPQRNTESQSMLGKKTPHSYKGMMMNLIELLIKMCKTINVFDIKVKWTKLKTRKRFRLKYHLQCILPKKPYRA